MITTSAPDLCNFRLHHPEHRITGTDGQFLYQEGTVVVPWARRRPGRHSGPLTSPFSRRRLALITFDELGGIDGLAKWVEHTAELDVVLSMLTSGAFVDDLPHENRFLNVRAAAEGLHRHWHPVADDAEAAAEDRRTGILEGIQDRDDRVLVKKALRYAHEPALAERLRDLAGEVPLTAAAITADAVARWSNATAWTRNQLAHPNAPREIRHRQSSGLHPASGFDYLALADATYWIVAASMLARLGVPDALLAERMGLPRGEVTVVSQAAVAGCGVMMIS